MISDKEIVENMTAKEKFTIICRAKNIDIQEIGQEIYQIIENSDYYDKSEYLGICDYEDEYGYNAPNDGMKYVMCAFTFENKGDSDAYVSIYDFDCYADNTLCDQIYSLDDNDFMNTNLSSGRNVSFKTYYAVPVNANSIELEYETNAWTSEKVIIKLK